MTIPLTPGIFLKKSAFWHFLTGSKIASWVKVEISKPENLSFLATKFSYYSSIKVLDVPFKFNSNISFLASYSGNEI